MLKVFAMNIRIYSVTTCLIDKVCVQLKVLCRRDMSSYTWALAIAVSYRSLSTMQCTMVEHYHSKTIAFFCFKRCLSDCKPAAHCSLDTHCHCTPCQQNEFFSGLLHWRRVKTIILVVVQIYVETLCASVSSRMPCLYLLLSPLLPVVSITILVNLLRTV